MGPKNRERKQLNPFILAGVVFGVVLVVLLVISLQNIFRKNPYGLETKIDNISASYENLPQEKKDQIFNGLYSVIVENMADGAKVPESGALVREGTAEYKYDEEKRVYYGSFVVDIASVEQSYFVQFEWSPDKDNQNLGGYPVLITCVSGDLVIYSGQVCTDMFAGEVNWENEYQIDYTYGTTTSFKIREMIEKFLMETKGAGESYIMTVDEASLSRLKAQPDLTYRFRVFINDAESCEVTVRTDGMYGEKYIAVYVVGLGISRGYVMTMGDDYKNSLTTWMRGYTGISDLAVEYLTLK